MKLPIIKNLNLILGHTESSEGKFPDSEDHNNCITNGESNNSECLTFDLHILFKVTFLTPSTRSGQEIPRMEGGKVKIKLFIIFSFLYTHP